MNTFNTKYNSDYQESAAVALFHEYTELIQKVSEIELSQSKRNKLDERKLAKLDKSYKKYLKNCEGEKSPKNSEENRKQLCELLKINYKNFRDYVYSNNLYHSNLYNLMRYYIFHCKKVIKQEHALFSKSLTISKFKLKENMVKIENSLYEDFTAYELCKYLNVNYLTVINADFIHINPIDIILKLKSQNDNFSILPPYEQSSDTINDLRYISRMTSLAWREPIKETTVECFIEHKIDFLKNEHFIIDKYTKT